MHWIVTMIIGAVAEFVVVAGTAYLSQGVSEKTAIILGLVATAGPWVGTPYASFRNPDGTSAKVAYGLNRKLGSIDFK